ncbi:hypothetical protein Cgig2_030830 [Carnegiea gigantea]|uniref:Uncharacterized protein n=1 Tax=Carnegiea gigantea TaxID=171969 RepID=A0A9Q1JIF2_9CARY|nr:hypothetical protein Cgig2_030830 [Carnegiea gigantea]
MQTPPTPWPLRTQTPDFAPSSHAVVVAGSSCSLSPIVAGSSLLISLPSSPGCFTVSPNSPRPSRRTPTRTLLFLLYPSPAPASEAHIWPTTCTPVTHQSCSWSFLRTHVCTENHTSYAINTYFWRNLVLQAVILLLCTGSCIYSSSATSTTVHSSTCSPATSACSSAAIGYDI